MTDKDRDVPTRVAGLEEHALRSALDPYSQFYAAIATALLVLTFAPYYQGQSQHNLWGSFTGYNGVSGIVMMVVFALLIAALWRVFRPTTVGTLWTMSVSAVLLALLLGFDGSKPGSRLSWAGGATIGLCLLVLVLALLNVIRLMSLRAELEKSRHKATER